MRVERSCCCCCCLTAIRPLYYLFPCFLFLFLSRTILIFHLSFFFPFLFLAVSASRCVRAGECRTVVDIESLPFRWPRQLRCPTDATFFPSLLFSFERVSAPHVALHTTSIPRWLYSRIIRRSLNEIRDKKMTKGQ